MADNTAIMTREQLAVEDVKRLINIVVQLSNEVFKSGVDFGVIPGTGDKPVLLQPGMEKLLRALHLRAEYVERSKVEDFDAGLFFYRYECRLTDWETGICVGTAIGSANSHESKWRWRDSKRICPVCGKDAIIKGKQEYGGGWLCFAKKGGCGAKFSDGDPVIEAQTVGRVENPDIFDQMNTCDKIAQKRALGSAIKTVANVSMLYTVDLEDFAPYDTSNVVQGTVTEVRIERDPRSEQEVTGAGDQPARPFQPSPASTPPTSATNGASADPLAQFGLEQSVTVTPVTFKQWTEHEAKQWAKREQEHNLFTTKELLTALDVKRLGDWLGSVDEATAKLDAWHKAQIEAVTP